MRNLMPIDVNSGFLALFGRGSAIDSPILELQVFCRINYPGDSHIRPVPFHAPGFMEILSKHTNMHTSIYMYGCGLPIRTPGSR